MDSYEIGNRGILGSIFRHSQRYRRWHYAMLLTTNNNNSLSHLLNLNNNDYIYLMNLLGFIRIKNNNDININRPRFEAFIIDQKLSD